MGVNDEMARQRSQEIANNAVHETRHRSKEMIILLDCDGILSDFVGGVIKGLSDKGYGFLPEDVTTWDMSHCLGVENKLIYDIAGAVNFCSDLKVYPGAQEGVKQLQELGEVFIVTSPIWSSPTWMYERTRWLKRHFDISANHVVHTSAKHIVRGDVLIDDKASTVEKWLKHQPGDAFLWDARWNWEEGLSTLRVEGWSHLIRRIKGEGT